MAKNCNTLVHDGIVWEWLQQRNQNETRHYKKLDIIHVILLVGCQLPFACDHRSPYSNLDDNLDSSSLYRDLCGYTERSELIPWNLAARKYRNLVLRCHKLKVNQEFFFILLEQCGLSGVKLILKGLGLSRFDFGFLTVYFRNFLLSI